MFPFSSVLLVDTKSINPGHFCKSFVHYHLFSPGIVLCVNISG